MRVVVALAAAVLTVPTLMATGSAQRSPQTAAPAPPDVVLKSLAGRDLFEFYCASCHGKDGKGNGPAAAGLKKRPTDLTTLTERHRGTFPVDRVTAILKGDERLTISAHGSSDMPVWGPIFKSLDDRDAVNEQRIENIVKYIGTMQPKPRAAPDAAAQ